MSAFWNGIQDFVSGTDGEDLVGAISDPQSAWTDYNVQGVVDFVSDPTLENLSDAAPPGYGPSGVIDAAIGLGGINNDLPDWVAEDDAMPDLPPSGPGPQPSVAPNPSLPKPSGGCGCGCTGDDTEPMSNAACETEKTLLTTMHDYIAKQDEQIQTIDNQLCELKAKKKTLDKERDDLRKSYEERLQYYIDNCLGVPVKPAGGCPKPPPAPSAPPAPPAPGAPPFPPFVPPAAGCPGCTGCASGGCSLPPVRPGPASTTKTQCDKIRDKQKADFKSAGCPAKAPPKKKATSSIKKPAPKKAKTTPCKPKPPKKKPTTTAPST